MALQYQRTFISCKENSPAQQRSFSSPPSLGRRSDEDACEATSLQGLVQKTADIYEWPIDEQGNMSKGSFLHPEVCGRFCIRFFYGTCRQGQNCEFCHLEHHERKVKMNRAQRELFQMLGEAEVLALVLPHIERRCRSNGLNNQMLFVVDLLRRRSTSIPHPDGNSVQHARAVIPVLRKFTVARLLGPRCMWTFRFELIRQSPAFPSGFKEDLKKLVDRSLGRQ
ncbi:unnamed protein product [Cladocopium goreaui]|uniref:C3H1-type domain-containing protein n=1 Tax=Cladocopium goreaui TaxID=2562237 RepID=A0A9P1G2J0_9DINO|nr:unnamed protein product [Cladocopium goreaui]